MTGNERNELIDALIEGDISEADFLRLEAELSIDPSARKAYFDRLTLTQALAEQAKVSSKEAPRAVQAHQNARTQWRPLTAAAAGIVLGMFCTSMVYGFVAPRMGLVKKTPLVVYVPGMEKVDAIIDEALPDDAGVWGADLAKIVAAENGVQPLEGKHMMRLEPVPPEEAVKNRLSRVYQVLDLRSQPLQDAAEDAEVQITASFFAEKGDVATRYLIRAFALNETPEQATNGFWPKTEEDDVVSVKRTFDVAPGRHEWHTFSLKMPLPRGAKTLVFVLGAGRVEYGLVSSQSHYLDDVQVSLLNPESALP
jgi:hypothetical protein